MRDILIPHARASWERLQTETAAGGQSRTMWSHADGHEEQAGVTFRTRDQGFVLQHHSRVPV
jgi:hypothetical protein